jgi:hypothetical protein
MMPRDLFGGAFSVRELKDIRLPPDSFWGQKADEHSSAMNILRSVLLQPLW